MNPYGKSILPDLEINTKDAVDEAIVWIENAEE
jgi:hypothetical protein